MDTYFSEELGVGDLGNSNGPFSITGKRSTGHEGILASLQYLSGSFS
jgi:hypothetical protein